MKVGSGLSALVNAKTQRKTERRGGSANYEDKTSAISAVTHSWAVTGVGDPGLSSLAFLHAGIARKRAESRASDNFCGLWSGTFVDEKPEKVVERKP